MFKFTSIAVAAVSCMVILPAKADFVVIGNGWQSSSTSLNITSQSGGTTSFTGSVGAQTIGIATDVSVDTASGNAIISAHSSSAPLRSVTFDPVNGIFTSFSFRGSLDIEGEIKVTVTDNFGQEFIFFNANANQNFGPFSVGAVTGTNEFINTVQISVASPNDFRSAKIFDFGNALAPALLASSIPESSTWAMMIMGFCGVGFLAHRRKKGRAAIRVA